MYSLAALCATGAAFFWPIMRRVDPETAATVWALQDYGRYWEFSEQCSAEISWHVNADEPRRTLVSNPGTVDPWGNPWRWQPDPSRAPRVGFIYSAGPDGVAEVGSGDDVIMDLPFAVHPVHDVVPVLVRSGPRRFLLVLSAFLSVSALVLHRLARSPRGTVGGELLRSLVLSAPLIVLGPFWVSGVHDPYYLDRAIQPALPGMLMRPSTVIPLSWAALVFLPTLGWRLSRRTVDT